LKKIAILRAARFSVAIFCYSTKALQCWTKGLLFITSCSASKLRKNRSLPCHRILIIALALFSLF